MRHDISLDTQWRAKRATPLGRGRRRRLLFSIWQWKLGIKTSWELIFYSESSNWGTPDDWDDSKVALRLSVGLTTLEKDVETLTISIDELTTSGASLNITWDRVRVSAPFSMNTRTKVIESIDNALAGPSGNDFYRAAKYYFAEKIDKVLALEWIGKAVEMRGVEAFWMTRLQAQIMAWNGQYKLAIEVAQISMKAASDQGNETYVRMNEASTVSYTHLTLPTKA